jgi:hypothetical protein
MKSKTTVATAAGAAGGVVAAELFKLPFEPEKLLEFGQAGLAALMALLGFYLYWEATHAQGEEIERKGKVALQFLVLGMVLFVITVAVEVAKMDLNNLFVFAPFGVALLMLAAGFFLYYKQIPRATQFMLAAGCAFLLGLLAIKFIPRKAMTFIELPPISDSAENHERYGAIMIKAEDASGKVVGTEKASERRAFPVHERLDLTINVQALTRIADKFWQQQVPPLQQVNNSVPDLTPAPR